ncbi:prephenate dehydrogenase [Caldalkalibacillus mannanilyticus]|uniref:prephenate dehydrogenase n=1 Tax=Caldalkalibacillus mannanilyticus TaxID=1418 RepID=UPI000469EC7E|nr:prephenate dehydrogenase [Caldalkalibacillus mannanilyticus]
MIHVSMIGIGLIGGSIALSLKKQYGQQIQIKGFDNQTSQLHLAESLGVIDQAALRMEDVIKGADVIFLCTPVQVLCELLEKVMASPYLKIGAIITDVGSTKEQIVRLSNEIGGSSNGVFIGGHPMAGSHKSGVEAAHDRLFENAYYVLTPDHQIDAQKVAMLEELLLSTQAKIVKMAPAEHDQIVGAISHFPHLIASSLVEQVHHYHEENEWYLRLAAGGFRDITRIASSNPRMWRDIILSNKSHLLKQMEDWQAKMEQVKDMIATGDASQIEHFFAHAKQVRDGLPERTKGAIPSFYDLYVDVPDHPGVIGQVTTLLGEKKISITNLEILETREDIMGVLRLSFRHEEDLEEAKNIMSQANYAVYRRE